MDKIVKREEWYKALIDECKSIITEAIFNSRWALVEGYHDLGERVRTDLHFKEYAKGTKTSVQDLARNIDISERTLYYAVQFYDTYPDLSQVPEGKNITWNKLITKYLPAHKEKDSPPLPPGKYRVIYADPPWRYGDKLVEGYGAAEHHYPTMSIEELCELPIKDMAGDDAVLFLWVTSPVLEMSLMIIEAWGFEYRASFIWDKVKHNYGHYNSVRHEFLLICIKGSCLPDNKELHDSVISIERTEHSQKPEYFRSLIDEMYIPPKTRDDRIELFVRGELPKHWDSWGNEI